MADEDDKEETNPTARYELVDADQLPPGKVCGADEKPGLFVFLWCRGEATQELVDDLNHLHKEITRLALWEQRWDDRPDRLELTGENLGIASASFEFAPPEMPMGRTCRPAERKGRFTWYIRPGEMTEQLRVETNAYLDHILGNGLWVQKWPETPEALGELAALMDQETPENPED